MRDQSLQRGSDWVIIETEQRLGAHWVAHKRAGCKRKESAGGQTDGRTHEVITYTAGVPT